MQFSKMTRGFYADELLADYKAAGTLPTDLQPLSDVEHEALMQALAQGHSLDWSGAAPVAIAPAALTLTDVKAGKLAELATACGQRMGAIKAGYPQDEISTWDKQESEARAYTANSSAATPLLSALATARGITLADLASRVIAKADAFAAASGAIIGKRQHYEDQVAAATDAATVEAIVWQD